MASQRPSKTPRINPSREPWVAAASNEYSHEREAWWDQYTVAGRTISPWPNVDTSPTSTKWRATASILWKATSSRFWRGSTLWRRKRLSSRFWRQRSAGTQWPRRKSTRLSDECAPRKIEMVINQCGCSQCIYSDEIFTCTATKLSFFARSSSDWRSE